MTPRIRVAFWTYLLLLVAGAAWGVGFLLRTEFSSYHGAAAGVRWTAVPPNFQVVILALTRLAGGLWVATALAILVVLLIPFRHGARWALWAVPLLMLAQYLAPMPAMAHLSAHSNATPPWALTLGCIVATLVVFAASLTGKRVP